MLSQKCFMRLRHAEAAGANRRSDRPPNALPSRRGLLIIA